MIQQKSIQNGLVGGGIILAFYLIINLINPELLFNTYLVYIPWIVYLAFMANSGKFYTYHTEQFQFRNCFANVWITGLIILLITIISQYLLYNLINPNLHVTEFDLALENYEKRLQILNEKQIKSVHLERIEGFMDNLKAENFKKTPKNSILSIPFGIIFPVSTFALLICAILHFMNKRKLNG